MVGTGTWPRLTCRRRKPASTVCGRPWYRSSRVRRSLPSVSASSSSPWSPTPMASASWRPSGGRGS
eukprot:9357291-Pyramimonas_sp.AAC.2